METVQLTKEFVQGEPVYVGIDCHKNQWSVVIRCKQETLYDKTIPAEYENLKKIFSRLEGGKIQVVYEAGNFGYQLHDRLVADGHGCIVTPPSLVPAAENRVKTDRRDATKLAMLLAGNLLKSVYVLEPQHRGERELLRTYQQVERHRKRVQCQIKSKLLFYGKHTPKGIYERRWSKDYRAWIRGLEWDDEWQKRSADELLEVFEFLDVRYKDLRREIARCAMQAKYRERVKLLCSVPGVGIFTAMVFLTEIQDVKRFRRADQLASYLGVTPSQYSTSDHLHLGHISRCGNKFLRYTLVESAWTLIRKDPAMQKKYETIANRRGSKRAIVAIAKTLAIRMRRLLLDNVKYQKGVVA